MAVVVVGGEDKREKFRCLEKKRGGKERRAKWRE